MAALRSNILAWFALSITAIPVFAADTDEVLTDLTGGDGTRAVRAIREQFFATINLYVDLAM